MIIQISKHISAIEMNATLTFSLFWRYLLTPNVCYPISITLFVQTGDADKGIFPWFVFWYLMPFKFFQKKTVLDSYNICRYNHFSEIYILYETPQINISHNINNKSVPRSVPTFISQNIYVIYVIYTNMTNKKEHKRP